MTELLEKRSHTAKHFDLGDGIVQGLMHIGHIHYPDGALKDGAFQDIDTTLEYNSASQSYQMTKASYEAEIGLYGDVRFHNVDHSLTFTLDNKDKVQAIPSDDEWGVVGKGLVWKDIIQKGGHQLVQVRNGSLAKIFHFDEKPKSNIIDFAMDLTGGIDFAVSNEKPTKDKATIVKSKQTLLVSSGGRETFIRPAKAWNHRRETIDIELSFYLDKDEKLRAAKTIPQDFIDQTFTEKDAWVECDTTTSYYVGAGDGFVRINAAANFTTARSAANGNDASAGLVVEEDVRFLAGNFYFRRGFFPIDTSGIGAGNVVSGATFVVFSAGALGDNTRSIAIIQTTMADPTNLVVADYSHLTLNSPPEGATRITFAQMGGSQIDVTLNATGIGWVQVSGWTLLGMRDGTKDVDDVAPIDDGAFNIWSSSSGGTAPYLSVTYSAGAIAGNPMQMII